MYDNSKNSYNMETEGLRNNLSNRKWDLDTGIEILEYSNVQGNKQQRQLEWHDVWTTQ